MESALTLGDPPLRKSCRVSASRDVLNRIWELPDNGREEAFPSLAAKAGAYRMSRELLISSSRSSKDDGTHNTHLCNVMLYTFAPGVDNNTMAQQARPSTTPLTRKEREGQNGPSPKGTYSDCSPFPLRLFPPPKGRPSRPPTHDSEKKTERQ